MKSYLLMLLLSLPVISLAQMNRKGAYGNLGIGYGNYHLDLFDYAGGRDLYVDQQFSGPVISLGVEGKSIWQKNGMVLDAGGELSGGFVFKTKATGSGSIAFEEKGGYMLGIKGLAKFGYMFPKGDMAIVPLAGAGPYFNYINSGIEDADGNYIYGVQAYLGVDFQMNKMVITPEIHFGVASWGGSDEMDQNGQPSSFEVKIKFARRF